GTEELLAAPEHPGADDEVGAPLGNRRDQVRYLLRLVGAIRIDEDHDRVPRRMEADPYGIALAPPVVVDHSRPERARNLARPVPGAAVDDDQVVGQALQALQNAADGLLFVQRRDDEAERGRRQIGPDVHGRALHRTSGWAGSAGIAAGCVLPAAGLREPRDLSAT